MTKSPKIFKIFYKEKLLFERFKADYVWHLDHYFCLINDWRDSLIFKIDYYIPFFQAVFGISLSY